MVELSFGLVGPAMIDRSICGLIDWLIEKKMAIIE